MFVVVMNAIVFQFFQLPKSVCTIKLLVLPCLSTFKGIERMLGVMSKLGKVLHVYVWSGYESENKFAVL